MKSLAWLASSWKWPIAIALMGAIAYGGICLYLFARQNRFIFFPTRAIHTSPADYDVAYEDVWLDVPDNGKGERIHGWWLPGPEGERPAGVLLYLHGNGSNVGANLEAALRFRQFGFSVLLVDYRGYGRSQGDFPTETSVYRDAERAWDYLTRERGIEPGEIFIYGHSLGGAVAIDLAARNPEAAGAIVEASFTSMRDMVDYQYPFFQVFPVDFLLTHEFDSLSKVSTLNVPILFVHGARDAVVPASMSARLYDAAPEPKRLLMIPEADHHNIGAIARERYFKAMEELVAITNQLEAKNP
ncbi:alpha/beta fold hydrolase [Oxynema sp. CENA135]|uniref:alpha/beta hydrolase n=1 Tax=Oxynema sp. CENA135 TaxID=984206 RepID=UPI00190D0703|nr:alpha/beta fold hydrolase [Oxynema sp. CENA135]MBK4729949.1 alpha/beta fold hydrolase [Oxynema sp. CENA135]